MLNGNYLLMRKSSHVHHKQAEKQLKIEKEKKNKYFLFLSFLLRYSLWI